MTIFESFDELIDAVRDIMEKENIDVHIQDFVIRGVSKLFNPKAAYSNDIIFYSPIVGWSSSALFRKWSDVFGTERADKMEFFGITLPLEKVNIDEYKFQIHNQQGNFSYTNIHVHRMPDRTFRFAAALSKTKME